MHSFVPLAWITLLALGAAMPEVRNPSCAPVRCTCVGYRSLREQQKSAREVFVGTVVAMRDTSIGMNARSRFTSPARMVQLVVRARWKGAPADTTIVWTYADEGMCAVPFKVGEEWLVLVESEDRQVFGMARGCSRTLRTDQAIDELRDLGPPLRAPAPNEGW